ncbi:hypothetical protein NBRC116592_31820 [Colwellia sp. KU-HH00111]|uniref:hypothetical protein n=1 Tax=Colwellia sp. KU-HH00111 TaxID=3127652 RepID=UPI0031083405
MRTLLSSPAKMALSDTENSLYQKSLTYIAKISLNLLAVKVSNKPADFLGWCVELLSICKQGVNRDLLEADQFKPLEKLEAVLELGASASQLKMLRIAPWPVFVSFIEQQTEVHAFEERLRLLDYMSVQREALLQEMTELDRLAFAGKHTSKHAHTKYDFDVEWFTSTKGAKIFHSLLAEQASDFDYALSFIPLTGDVTPAQYQQFVHAYKNIFTRYTKDKKNGEKASLIPATRLLAMRRPDQFIALTNAKIDVLCQGLGIVKFNSYDFDGYWQYLIGTLRTFAWWHESEPSDESEHKIWCSRAILIDLFLYADQDTAFNSNYLRLREKALNITDGTYKPSSKTRTKLTVDEQVDLALSADDLPEYIVAKRESIITEVKKGKSVDHVIGLMRAIFG